MRVMYLKYFPLDVAFWNWKLAGQQVHIWYCLGLCGKRVFPAQPASAVSTVTKQAPAKLHSWRNNLIMASPKTFAWWQFPEWNVHRVKWKNISCSSFSLSSCLWKPKSVNELPLFPKLHRDIYGILPSELAFLCKCHPNDFLWFEQLLWVVTFSGFKVTSFQRNKPNLIKSFIQGLTLRDGWVSLLSCLSFM